MGAVYRRELQGYFFTPVGYVFAGVFLTLGSVFFGAGNLAIRSSSMMSLLRNMSYLWMLLCPVLTMRLIAGEKSSGTFSLLFSSPCSLTAIVGGKFFSACTVMLATVALSFVFPILIAIYGKLYLAETLVGYLGFLLQGGCFIALDMTVSCLTRNPVTAAIACFGVNLGVWFFDVLSAVVQNAALTDVLSFFSLYQRLTPFTLGQLSFANVLFSLTYIFAMLFLCVRLLDARRWSEVQS